MPKCLVQLEARVGGKVKQNLQGSKTYSSPPSSLPFARGIRANPSDYRLFAQPGWSEVLPCSDRAATAFDGQHGLHILMLSAWYRRDLGDNLFQQSSTRRFWKVRATAWVLCRQGTASHAGSWLVSTLQGTNVSYAGSTKPWSLYSGQLQGWACQILLM